MLFAAQTQKLKCILLWVRGCMDGVVSVRSLATQVCVHILSAHTQPHTVGSKSRTALHAMSVSDGSRAAVDSTSSGWEGWLVIEALGCV